MLHLYVNAQFVRTLVSSVLGNGILGKLVDDPLMAADNFGLDVTQLGLNRTLIQQRLGIEKNSSTTVSSINFATDGTRNQIVEEGTDEGSPPEMIFNSKTAFDFKI